MIDWTDWTARFDALATRYGLPTYAERQKSRRLRNNLARMIAAFKQLACADEQVDATLRRLRYMTQDDGMDKDRST